MKRFVLGVAFSMVGAVAGMWLWGCAVGKYAPMPAGEQSYARQGAVRAESQSSELRLPMTVMSPKTQQREPWESTGTDTELWVISKASPDQETDDAYGSPSLSAKLPGQERAVLLPLENTDVHATISGFVATVDVEQKYHNPYTEKIETEYVFPLPHTAAVTDFVMTIGDRKIRGLIREKEEAVRIYEQARQQGYQASLLTQERPNVFKQKVANIEPGKRIDILVSFFSPLPYKDGEFEFVFPTVVGPRFNPPGSTDGVGAVSHGKPARSGQSTEVQYLPPEEKSGHDISIRVDIDAGTELDTLYSGTHAIRTTQPTASTATVTLSPEDTIPNKDFILRYRTAGHNVKSAFMVHKAKDGKYFAMMLQPPVNMEDIPRMPREMVFVLDCSGSMSGKPLQTVKNAVRRCMRRLNDDDTFQIIQFSEGHSSLGSSPIPATANNVAMGLKYLDSLSSGGGTMMIQGIKAALDFPHSEERLRIVSFMTDGFIGNESEILAAIKERLGASRILSFGVGSAPNRYLLENMAKIGRGAVAYVNGKEGMQDTVDQFYERASRPALTDIEVEWGGLRVTDVYPRVIPDLFVGRPLIITGRLAGEAPAQIRIQGRCGLQKTNYSISVNPGASKADHQGIRSVWARWKIADLSEQELRAPTEALRREILATSLNYGLLSRYTALLAVDGSAKTKGDHGYTVSVPVPVPEGVRYDTTVSE